MKAESNSPARLFRAVGRRAMLCPRSWPSMLALLLALIGLAAGASRASAQVTIYQDLFNDQQNINAGGSYTQTLAGSHPTVRNAIAGGSASATWTGSAETGGWGQRDYNNNGVATPTSSNYLPFTPQAGHLYVLTATIDATAWSAGDKWFTIGFTSLPNNWVPGNYVADISNGLVRPGSVRTIQLTLDTRAPGWSNSQGLAYVGWFTASPGGANLSPSSVQVTIDNFSLVIQDPVTNTYDANGATSGTAPVDSSNPYLLNATVTVLGNTGNLAKTGFNFGGWNTAADGSGTTYPAGSTFAITSNTVLYAKWVEGYSVAYNANGGINPPVDTTVYSSGATVTVSNVGSMTRSGFAFTGWNTAADGSGTAFSAGSTFSIVTSTNLYAQWNLTDGTWNNAAATGNWNTTDTNWTGVAWSSGANANFTTVGGTINLTQPITAGSVSVGNTSLNVPNTTFTNGSLTASSLTVQGYNGNGGAYSSNPTLTLGVPTVSVAGDIAVGRANLAIATGTVTANRIISASGSADWADVVISGGTVTATNGVDGYVNTTATFQLDLNGGSLYTPYIKVADREAGPNNNALLNFNGTVVHPTVSTNNFIQIYAGSGNGNTFVGNGGVTFSTDGNDINVSAAMLVSGNGGVTKAASGTLTLSAANTYTGATVVSNGTLVVNGSLGVSSAVTVWGGALGGRGTIGGAVTVKSGANLLAGADGTYGTNTLTSTLTLESGAICTLDVGTVYNGTNDRVNVTGAVTLNNTAFHLKAPSTSANLDTTADYVLMTGSSIAGTPTLVWDVQPANASQFAITKTATQVVLRRIYTVTYDGNGNTSGSAPTDSSSPYFTGSTVTVLGNTGGLAKTGENFGGWNTAADGSGTPYTAGATFTITSNTVLYARWVSGYTVTYDGNGNTGGSVPVDANAYSSGTPATVLGTNTLFKTGNSFAGWNTAANGSGSSYNPTDSLTVNANTTLYAQWTPNQYTATYQAGTGGTISGTATQTVNYGTSTTSVTATPNAGYHFTGWSDAVATATRSDVNFAANFTVTANFDNNLTWNNGAGTTNWNTTDANWTGYAWSNGANAIFNNINYTVNLTEAITGGSLSFNTGGNPSGSHQLQLSGSSLSFGSITVWGGYNPSAGNGGVDNIGQAYAQQLAINNMTLTNSGDVSVRRGMLSVTNATLNVGGMIKNPDAWTVFREDNSTVTVAGGIDFSSIAAQVELRGGTVSTPFIKVGNAAFNGTGGLYLSGGVTVVPTQASTDFLQVFNNGDTNNRAAATIESGSATFNTAYDVTNKTLLNGGGGLTKTGSGTLTLSGSTGGTANSYSGATTINSGVLAMGSGTAWILHGNSAVTVNAGATLQGNDSLANQLNGLTLSNGTVSATGSGHGDWGNFYLSGDVSASGTSTLNGDIALRAATVKFGVSGSDTLNVGATLHNGANFGAAAGGTPANVVKNGTGTMVLTAANTYSGNTVVSNGTLLVNGSIGSGAVSVNGGTLGGSGTISGAVTVNSGGTLAPGTASIGTLTINNTLTLSGAANFRLDTSSTPTSDKITGATSITAGGTLQVTLNAGTLASGNSFQLFNKAVDGGWFSSVSLPPLAVGLAWDTNSLATSGALDVYNFTTTALEISTPKNSNAVISASKLANHVTASRAAIQADNKVVSVGTAATNGTASVSEGVLTYAPNANYAGDDHFTVTFSDGHGTQTMSVSVTVGSGNGTSPNLLGQMVDGSNFVLKFAGYPGETYTVETNPVVGPGWVKLGNVTAPTDGIISVTNTMGTNSLFFRTVWPAY